jgi:hypothetical protein
MQVQSIQSTYYTNQNFKSKTTNIRQASKAVKLVEQIRDAQNRIRYEEFSDGTYRRCAYIDDFSKGGYQHYFYGYKKGGLSTKPFADGACRIYRRNVPMVLEEKLNDGTINFYHYYITTKDISGHGMETAVNCDQRLIKQICPDGIIRKYKYKWEYQPMMDGYNLFGHWDVAEPEGYYSVLSQVVETYPDKTVKKFYDSRMSKLKEIISPEGLIRKYNKKGKLEAEIWPKGSTSYLGYNRITYYENGNYEAMKKPNGDYIKYYENGIIMEEKNSDGLTTYFEDGLIKQKTDSNGIVIESNIYEDSK